MHDEFGSVFFLFDSEIMAFNISILDIVFSNIDIGNIKDCIES